MYKHIHGAVLFARTNTSGSVPTTKMSSRQWNMRYVSNGIYYALFFIQSLVSSFPFISLISTILLIQFFLIFFYFFSTLQQTRGRHFPSTLSSVCVKSICSAIFFWWFLLDGSIETCCIQFNALHICYGAEEIEIK